MRLGAERDDVGELGDRLEVAEGGEAREPEGVELVAGEQRQVAIVVAQPAPVAVVQEVALADRLDDERDVVGRDRPRAGRPRRARRARGSPSAAPARASSASASSPPCAAQRAGRRSSVASVGTLTAISANAAAAASTVRSTCSGAVGERREPRLELRRRRVDAARQQRPAPGAVGLEVAGLRARVVAHRLGGEEHGQQAGRGRDLTGRTPRAAASRSPSASALGRRAQAQVGGARRAARSAARPAATASGFPLSVPAW